MLHNQTLEKLHALKLHGMADAFREQLQSPACDPLSFAERFGLLVDRQWDWKENARMQRYLRAARLKLPACIEDIDFRTPRGIDRDMLAGLASCDWVRHHRNVLVTGPTGVGKTFIACALAHKACREGYRALYLRCPGSSSSSPWLAPTAATASSLPGSPRSMSCSSMTWGLPP